MMVIIRLRHIRSCFQVLQENKQGQDKDIVEEDGESLPNPREHHDIA